MNLWLNILLALRSIKANMLRTVLTFMIIAIGIMALVGILTSIDGMSGVILSQTSQLGSNSFTIRSKGIGLRSGRGGLSAKKPKPPLVWDDARDFVELFEGGKRVSLSTNVSASATLKYRYEKTSPNISVLGVDEHYVPLSGFEFENGRNFSVNEMRSGSNVIILGAGVAAMLSMGKTDLVDQYVYIGNRKYLVIGILLSKGQSMMGSDNRVFISIPNARKNYLHKEARYVISVQLDSPEELDYTIEEAQGIFRIVRGLDPSEEDDFDISRSDRIATTVMENMEDITMAATLIGIITLLGAGIGLMNIMLVSVGERTREIGVSKALGATNKAIRLQFLVEAVVICQIGGIIGIILGVPIGNVVSLVTGGPFMMPWQWITAGFIFCFVVGLLAGIYPAIKASRLDPIEALRYE